MFLKTINVDLDGVLVDQYEPFSIYLNEDYETIKKRLRLLELQDEVKANQYKIPLLKEISSTDIFSRVRPTQGCQILVNSLKGLEAKGISINILSSLMRDNEYADNLAECKQKWLERNGIHFNQIFVQGRHEKQKYANNSSLLIDDTFSNIRDWTSNGGYGIHHTSHTNTLNYLFDLELL